jgi:hypothetical protein
LQRSIPHGDKTGDYRNGTLAFFEKAFVTSNFTGGAFGSIMAGVLYAHGGWYTLVGGQTAIIAVALLTWALGRKTLLQLGRTNRAWKW